MKYALLKMSIRDISERFVILDYDIYIKCKGSKDYDRYTLIGVLESDYRSAELLEIFSDSAETRVMYYKNKLDKIARIIKSSDY